MKTDSNMNIELQQSRIQLSGPKGNNLTLAQENLKEVRKELRNKRMERDDDMESDSSGEEKAMIILNGYLVHK